MRNIKVVGLVAVAALAVTAIVGPSSAMAVSKTALCKVEQRPCPAGNTYPGGTHIHGAATNVKLLSMTVNVECASSVLLANQLNELEKPITAEITVFTFTGCIKEGGGNCEVKAVALGQLLFLNAIANFLGTVTQHNTSVLVKCGIVIHCVFGGLRVLHWPAPGESEKAGLGELEENEGVVESEKGICPTQATWDSHYVITLPTPIYISE